MACVCHGTGGVGWPKLPLPAGVRGPVAELIGRHTPVVAIMNDFYWNVFGVSRATPYPAQEITRAMAVIDGFGPAPSAERSATRPHGSPQTGGRGSNPSASLSTFRSLPRIGEGSTVYPERNRTHPPELTSGAE
jgi:hypothetical protein